MTTKFDDAVRRYYSARLSVAEGMIEMSKYLHESQGMDLTAATIAKHDASMSKIQMVARKIVEAALDAQVEIAIADGEPR